MTYFVTSLKELIADGKTSVVLTALTDFLRDKDEDLHNQCILHQNSFKITEQKISRNLIDDLS